MMLPIVLSEESTQDLQNARDWYESQRTGLGVKFAQFAASTLDNLSLFPQLYGLVWEDVRAIPIRRFPYVIYYRLLADRVEVLAILHARQDPEEWQRRT